VKRLRAWTIGLIAAAIAVASVSRTSPITLQLTDEQGRPASEGYVRFHYYGYLINPVHPVTYARESTLIRIDGDGRMTIPARIHLRRPLPLSTPPSAFIDQIYVPPLHNAFGPVAEQTMSRPGVFTIGENRAAVTIADVSASPEHWELSLRNLFDCILGTLIRSGSAEPLAPRDRETAALARELIDHLRREYAAFQATYGHAARQRPAEPQWGSERDRQLWREQIDAQLAREPLWGPFMERVWEHNLKELNQLEAALR
jgi:hypothetical protein